MLYLCYICAVLGNLAFQESGPAGWAEVLLGQWLSPNPAPGEKAQRNGCAHPPWEFLVFQGRTQRSGEWGGEKWNDVRFLEPCFALSPLFSPCENPKGIKGQIWARVQLSSRTWEFEDGILPFPLCSNSGNLPQGWAHHPNQNLTALLGAPNLLRALVDPGALPMDFGGPGIFGTSLVFPYKEFFLLSELLCSSG